MHEQIVNLVCESEHDSQTNEERKVCIWSWSDRAKIVSYLGLMFAVELLSWILSGEDNMYNCFVWVLPMNQPFTLFFFI